MAFDISKVGGYGTGSLGNVVVPYGTVSEYPTRIQTYTSSPAGTSDYASDCYPGNIYPEGLTEGGATLYLGGYSWVNTFLTVGSAVLFVQMRHKKELSGGKPTAEELADYGKYEVRTITAIDGDNYTFDQAPAMDFANYYVAIVPFLDFENLTLNSGGRLCLLRHEEGLAEGILAVRVKNTLTLNGGHIDLFTWAAFFKGNRAVLTEQEKNGALDADAQAGLENFITKDRFLLNGGQEGGLFLLAKNIVVENADSRIGVGFALWNAERDYWFIDGVQYCRGAADSPNRPTDLTIPSVEINGVYATNKSGATILIACETFEGFTPALIAKYTMYQEPQANSEFDEYGNGKGLARCYIACKNPPAGMKHDEGLYALDVLTDGDRLRGNRVFTFGNGSSGDVTNPTGQINSYAAISGISSAQVTLSNISSGSCPFEVGAMVMIHATAKSEPPEGVSYVTLAGAATLSNPHIQTYVEPSGDDDTTPSGEDDTTPSGTPGIMIENTESDVLITGTENDDTISNVGLNVTIDAGAGDDSIRNESYDVTIDAGSGDDSIYNGENGSSSTFSLGGGNDTMYNKAYDVQIDAGEGDNIILNESSSVTIKTGSGADSIYNKVSSTSIEAGGGNDTILNEDWEVTIKAGTGDDIISLRSDSYSNLIVYNAGDGNDTIYGFNEYATLSIVGGTYSTLINGDDVLVQVGNDTISLVGAAGLEELNIEGTTAVQSKTFKSKALTAESGITNREDNATIYGTAGNDTITNYGKDCTIISGSGDDEIHLASGSKRSVIVVGMGSGANTYAGIGDTDTILVSLTGEEYQEERTSDYVKIKLRDGKTRREPCSDGVTVSVTGGILVEEFTPEIPSGWIGNTDNNVSVQGTSGTDSIVNYGSNVTIISGAGDDIISLSSSSKNNVIVRKFNGGLGEYYGLDSSDTILISLDGGTYWEQRESNFVRIHYGNVIRSEPCSEGNAVSVVGATKIDHPSESLPSDWIVNRADNVSIYGSGESDTIANFGSNCTIWGGKGDDTISLDSGSANNVVITRFDDGVNSYIGLDSLDTLLVSLNGGEYFSTVETDSSGKTYSVVCYGKGQMSLPTSSGNAVSVKGGTRLDYIRISNARNSATITGDNYPEYITNTGSSTRISCGGGNDTVENHGDNVYINLGSGRNVLNNSGGGADIYSNGQNSINNSGAHTKINFSGSDTVSMDSGARYVELNAQSVANQAVIYGFNGTATISNAGDYTLEPVKPDLKVNLDGASILLKNVYKNTGVIHINDAAIAISPDEYTYKYAAGDGNIAISGFEETSTLNVTGNFIWERRGNDIIVGVSENGTPVMYTGDISAIDFPRDSDFKLAKVLSYSGGKCSLDTTFNASPDDYYLQLISIPQYKNFTLSTSYSATPKFENGRGGICALAVSETCNLSGGKLNVENKGHGLNTGNELDGNAFMRNHLPLGNGHGSIFLLAKDLKMNTSTRIGATNSGAAMSSFNNYGGKRGTRDFGSKQGAHVLIVADKITGMNDAAISTGGDGAGAGYGDSDGVSGSAFIYCNDTG